MLGVGSLFFGQPASLICEELHDNNAAAQSQSRLYGVRKPRPGGIVFGLVLDDDAVDDDVDRVHLVAIERDSLIKVSDPAIDSHPYEPRLPGVLEHFVVL